MSTTFDHGGRDVVESCDAVVIGTGAGGGAIAAELAEGGWDVVLVEEGGHYTSKDFRFDAPEMLRKLYRHAGTAVIRGKPNVIFAEGRCVGGSTVINGAVSWRTPEKVLKRWAWEHGLAGMTPKDLELVFAKVEERVHVAPQDPGTVGQDSELVKKGAERLGYETVPILRSQKHCCGSGNCCFGCPTDAKQSSLVAYVPRALARGARLYAGCKANKITTDGHKATGIVARFIDPETREPGPTLTVRAPVVVLACGAVQTPALLLRNKLANSSGQVGRNFYIHPNAKLIAQFDEDVSGWKGTIQGYQVREFDGEGIMMTTTSLPPGLTAMTLPEFGDESLTIMKQYNHLTTCGVLVEDSATGRVSLDWFGEPKMTYDLHDRDRDVMVRGLALLSEILFEAGARRIHMPFHSISHLDSPDEIRRLFAAPIAKRDIETVSIHVMGTCRMGNDPASSVVNPFGETHDVPGLFVADASVFPTAVGTNPQITVMALATRTGQFLLARS